MSRTKKNRKLSNRNQKGDDSRRSERRPKNNAINRQYKLSTAEEIAIQAHKRLRRVQKRLQERSFSEYVEDDLRLVRKHDQLCLMGKSIEVLAQKMTNSVPESASIQRRLTEGYPYYITIATSKEMPRRMRADKKVKAMNDIAIASPPFVNLGFGMVQNEENSIRSWHCVISWPAGQQIRMAFGLRPRNLHLTLGYYPQDLNIPKGPSTLIHYSSPVVMNSQQIISLISTALIESFTSKEGSLLSLMLASAQAKVIGNKYLVLAAKHSLNRVQRRESLEEFKRTRSKENMEYLRETCTKGNCLELAGFMQYNMSQLETEMASLAMAQQTYDNFPFYKESGSKTMSVKDVITKLESLKVDQACYPNTSARGETIEQ